MQKNSGDEDLAMTRSHGGGGEIRRRTIRSGNVGGRSWRGSPGRRGQPAS